ncbi:MAG: tetratricopeptide repeat protein [Clostridia bacterium]|nr:tetratricopeptide repeat protein [Clostridia bacterium]
MFQEDTYLFKEILELIFGILKRRDKKINQSSLADFIFKDRSMITKWKNNILKPDVNDLKNIVLFVCNESSDMDKKMIEEGILEMIQHLPDKKINIMEFERFDELLLKSLKHSITDCASPTITLDRPNLPGRILTSLPPKNIELIGRKKELQELSTRLKKAKRLLLVNGMGGIGKTELCKAFFWSNYHKYKNVGWIEYTESIKESFINQFHVDGLFLPDEIPDMKFTKLMRFLTGISPDSLIVIDNIENAADDGIKELCSLPVKILANSRINIECFEQFPLGTLAPEECTKLFYSFYQSSKDDAGVRDIIELSGFHTLTIELLAKTAQKSALKVKVLYSLLKTAGFNLNHLIKEKVETFWHNEKQKSNFFNLLLKVFNISNLGEEEKYVLMSLSIMPSMEIEINELRQWIGLESNDAINLLADNGWVKRNGFKIIMHQVLQEVIKFHTHPSIQKCKTLVQSFIDLLSLDPKENSLIKSKYVPYAEHILKHFSNEDCEKVAKLSYHLSILYRKLGDLNKAFESALKSITVRKKISGMEHPDTAAAMYNAALIYRYQGKYEEAAPLFMKALEIHEKALGQEHPDTAKILNDMALMQTFRGRYGEAEPAFKRALTICEKTLGPEHLDTASVIHALALMYSLQGKFHEAEALFKKDLEINQKVLGWKHTDTAITLSSLATLYKLQERYKEAESYYKKALSTYESIFGSNHPDIARLSNHLAGIYVLQERYDEAELLYKKDLAVSKKLFGWEHMETITTLNHLAELYKRTGRYEKAESLHQKALSLKEKAIKYEIPSKTVLVNSSELCKYMGRYEEDEQICKKVIVSS